MPETHPLSVLNPKALDRQVKVLEKRIHELKSELEELERMKLACRILMGEEAAAALAMEPQPPEATPAARPAKAKPKPRRVEEAIESEESSLAEPPAPVAEPSPAPAS